MGLNKHIVTNIAFVLIMIFGTLLIVIISNDVNDKNLRNRQIRLESANKEAVMKFKNSMVNFATLVASYRSFVMQCDTMPDVKRSQDFINQVLQKIDYKEEMIVSYIDTAHTFKFVFTRFDIDPSGLTGKSLKEFRNDDRIRGWDSLMTVDGLIMDKPINMVEGWLGIPLNFRVKRNGRVLGYVAPVLNFKSIIKPIYERAEINKEFVFKFRMLEGNRRFDREVVYDSTKVYNQNCDPESFIIYSDIGPEQYVSSIIPLYGKNIEVSTAFKKPYESGNYESYIIYIWLLSLIGFSFIFYRRSRNKEKLKSLLEKAFNDLSFRNKHVNQSISYARQIQNSVLLSPKQFKANFEDAFIINLPKEIVSGDFYWYSENEGKKVIGLSDCTGHGVPGAFMTLLGVSFLNEIINVGKITDPKAILLRLQEKVTESIRNHSVRSFDGMDISIITIDEEANTFTYCGMGNSVTIIQNGEIKELPGMLIGIGPYNHEFAHLAKNIELDLSSVQQVYMGSDGYQDQIGEETDRKFMKASLRRLIQKHWKSDASSQKKEFEQQFYKWKGENDQTDDVLLIGIKLN